jgi:hypothetical protein
MGLGKAASSPIPYRLSHAKHTQIVATLEMVHYDDSASLITECIMSTSKNRITISLENDQYVVLQRLARLQKAPMSRIVSDLVAEVSPILSRVADSLEIAVRAGEGVRANLRRAAQDAEAELEPIAEYVRNQFDLFAGELSAIAGSVEEAGSGRPEAQSPRPVTTGAMKTKTPSTKPVVRSRSGASKRAK